MATRRGSSNLPFEDFTTARAGSPLFCHQEFLEKMEANRNSPVGKRAALLLQRLLVDIRRQHYKSTQGVNRGWRRSALGGNHGFHFYAWWAPAGAAPLQDADGFGNAPAGSIFLRDIRHHDDHTPLVPQSLATHYLPIGVKELREEDYVPAPWTSPQVKFATARQNLRIIKGHPGSGKTTALWHAADLACRSSALYLTYSTDLAALARDYFDKFAGAHKRFRVLTYAQLLREMLGADVPFEPVRTSRTRFLKEVGGYSPIILGPWQGQRAALYDEMHAHLVGGLLPVPVGRFSGFADQRISARQYRDLRDAAIGRVASESVVEVAETLRKRDDRNFVERFFPELRLAWRASQLIRSNQNAVATRGLLEFDCIAVDEVQDLTPVESLVLVQLAAANSEARKAPVNLLVAGDEAQTVRPTDFEWGWFQDLVHHLIGSPTDFRLSANLRSPRRLAEIINRTGDLYSRLSKSDRPSGPVQAEIDDNSGDQILFCAAALGEELDSLLDQLSRREGMAIICLGDDFPPYLSPALRERVLTSFEAKGLDFQSVCILDGGRWLDQVMQVRERGRALELDDLTRRLAIDQLRVALSRPTERLIWLDVNPTERALTLASDLLSFDQREFPVVPTLVLATLDEDTLAVEDRVRMCENDARQLLEVKPALAWSRARQAVALLGDHAAQHVTDPETRRSAHLTLAQVAFTLAFRRVHLASQMGRPNFYQQARENAELGGRRELGQVLLAIGNYERETGEQMKMPALIQLGTMLAITRAAIEPWLALELKPHAADWIRQLEDLAADIRPDLIDSVLPKLYACFDLPGRDERLAALRAKAIERWISIESWQPALDLLALTPEPDPVLMAQCHEGLLRFDQAAECYIRAGKPADALRNYRRIPDFDKSLAMIEQLRDHPARDSLLWVKQMRDLAARRPADFAKVVLPAEKQLLEQVLETSLGVARKKAATRKAPAARKPAVKKVPARKPPARPRKESDPWF